MNGPMNGRYTLLIAEDDRRMAALLGELAESAGFSPLIAADGSAAATALERGEVDALLTDLRLPPPDGLALLRQARHRVPDLPAVLITGHATLSVAVDAFRGGLFDLIVKPFETAEVNTLLGRIRGVLDHRRRVESLRAQLDWSDREALVPLDRIPASRQTLALIKQVAALDVPMLLNGETGTGKSVTARLIHRASPRRDGPFSP